MNTFELIQAFKTRTHDPKLVCYKYALFSAMLDNNMSVYQIERTTGYNRATIYYGIRTYRNLIDISDPYALEVKAEVDMHTISVLKYSRKNPNKVFPETSCSIIIDGINYNDYGND